MEKRNQNLQQLTNQFKNTTTPSEQIQNIAENGYFFVNYLSARLSINSVNQVILIGFRTFISELFSNSSPIPHFGQTNDNNRCRIYHRTNRTKNSENDSGISCSFTFKFYIIPFAFVVIILNQLIFFCFLILGMSKNI